MDPLQFLIPLGWVETIGPIVPIAILVLTIINIITRFLSHRATKQQADAGAKDEELTRYFPQTFTTIGLLILGLLFMLYRPTSGLIITIPIAALLITEFFEFEARTVEARNDMPVELPKAGLLLSGVVLMYAAYYGLRFLYDPYLDFVFA